MSRYQAYPQYKESNIGWMGAVPESWSIIPCRAVVGDIAEKNVGAADQNYLSVMANVGVIRYEDKGDIGNKKPDDLSKCKIVRVGNLVINSMNYAIGSYGMSPYNGVCSPVYIVLRVNEAAMESRFALRIFENTPFQKYLATFGNGILEHRAAIGWDDIKGAHIALPSKAEQRAILNFLDHETAKIDALIEKQQRLIELLKEKRQAVISHAVTKGLNPNAPMKDSGVEWLGEVPAHWIVLQLRRVLNGMEQGKSPECESRPADLNEWGVLKTGCVNNGAFNFNENKFLPEHIAPFSQFEVKNGDVLMSRASGSVDLIGSVAYVNNPREKLLLSDKIFRLRFEPSVHKIFFTRLMQSSYMRSNIKVEISGAEGMANNITKSSINSFRFALPPFEEQASIAQAIEKKLSTLDRLIQRSVSGIDLLQERRTALISAAVTGKIDVRDWQAAA